MEFLNQTNIYQFHIDKMMKSISSLSQEDEKIDNVNTNGSDIDTKSSRTEEIGASIYEKKSSKSSGNLGHIVKYITDSIEAFID